MKLTNSQIVNSCNTLKALYTMPMCVSAARRVAAAIEAVDVHVEQLRKQEAQGAKLEKLMTKTVHLDVAPIRASMLDHLHITAKEIAPVMWLFIE